jgi:hypothetical protein
MRSLGAVLVSRTSKAPQLCDRRGGTCTGLVAWDGGVVVYLAPRTGNDFVRAGGVLLPRL